MPSQTKIALITGASRGLGRNTALGVAGNNGDVVLTYLSNREEGEAVVREIKERGAKAVALQLDTGIVADFDDFAERLRKALKDTWGRDDFDFLVNNAGFGVNAPVQKTTEEDFDRLMNVQLKGVYFLTQKLLPMIVDGGRIVNLSSGLARFSIPGMSAYAMMKGGIEVFTRYLAKEIGDRGITVNAVAPGAIETDFGGGKLRDDSDYNKMISSVTALGRAGVPDDIGPMIASLLTDANRWVNGQVIEVSGGMNL